MQSGGPSVELSFPPPFLAFCCPSVAFFFFDPFIAIILGNRVRGASVLTYDCFLVSSFDVGKGISLSLFINPIRVVYF